MLCSDTARAEVETFQFAFHHDGRRVYIGFRTAGGVPFGMADVIAELNCFAA